MKPRLPSFDGAPCRLARVCGLDFIEDVNNQPVLHAGYWSGTRDTDGEPLWAPYAGGTAHVREDGRGAACPGRTLRRWGGALLGFYHQAFLVAADDGQLVFAKPGTLRVLGTP